MSPVQLIPSIINIESIQKSSKDPLKPGQFVFGKVEKILPNDTAIIRIENGRVIAQLKATLSAEESYWFEVRSNTNNGIQLKVLDSKSQNRSEPSHLLIEHFQLPETKENFQLLQFFLHKNIPFTKEQMKTAAAWIHHQADSKELTALEWMIKKDLPFTEQTFQSLVAVQESQSFYQQLEKLHSYLENPKFSSSESIQQLKQLISIILGNQSINELENGREVKNMLQKMIQSLGLEYEKELRVGLKDNQSSFESLHSLKPMIMSVMNEPGISRNELEPILHRLTGMQLIAQDFTGPMQQMTMQLPIALGEKQTDVTIQWEGRKKSNGQLDPDYCRILFYLELQSLNKTMIDMQIQNRIVHVSVMNDTEELESIVKQLTPTLKQKLENLGYQLSFIKVIPSFEKGYSQKNILPSDFYEGVDVKI